MIQFFITWVSNFIPMWILYSVASIYADKRDILKNKRILLLASFALVATLLNQLHIPMLNAAVSLTLYIGVTLLFFHIVWYSAILLANIVWTIGAFAEILASLLLSSILGEHLAADFFTQDIVLIVAQSFTTLFLLAIFFIFQAITQKKKAENQFPPNLAIILFSIASALTAYYIVSIVVNVFPRQFTIYSGVVLAVFLVAINIASLFSNENARKWYILQNELDAMQHQEELTVGLLRQQEEHLKEMRTQAHDFKNHLVCLHTLVGNNGPAQNQFKQYIDELLQTVGGAEQFVDVRNEALRAVLVNAVTTCKAQGIEFRCRIDYSDFSFMSFSDISILLSNALNNAVEACEQHDKERAPWIDFKVLRKGEMLFIQLTNTIYHKIKMKNGVILSTKTQPEHHGIGFKNMERVAKCYGGNITLDYNDSEFRLYVNLPVGNTQLA